MQLGILGGTGPAGSGLAARLSCVGIDVVIGSRSADRADAVARDLKERWPDRELTLRGADNRGAAEADVVVVATPWDGASPTTASVADALAGKVVISMANALAKVGKEFEPLVPPRGSVAAGVQAAAPDALVAAALHHVPARELGDLDHPVESDVLVCSDHREATKVTSELIRQVPGMVPLDSGTLANAAPIEAFTAVLLQLNIRYKTHTALRITGIDRG